MEMSTELQQLMGDFEYVLELLATLFYAISGSRLAAAKKFDWFGAYSIGFITAVGGGTLRDVFLGVRPFWMLDIWFMIATVVGLIMVIVLRRWLVRIEGTFYLFDAVGLALFVDVGIYKSLMMGFPIWVAIIMGTLSGAFGGVIRDICINEQPLVFRKEVYATICIVGGFVYWLVGIMGGDPRLQQIVCGALIVIFRYFAVKHNLSVPILQN